MRKIKVDAYSLLSKIRADSPVVHHITNWVTIYDCASIVKALGASPVMAHAKEEVSQMVGISSSLVLNIGTLTTELVQTMKIAAKSANKKGIPVILDVCGAGATELRNRKSFELLEETRIDIIKGNPSEVARISGEMAKTKGVDAGDIRQDMIVLANKLALRYKCTVVVTGKEDIITNGVKGYLVSNGHSMMASVVGTGCMAASMIGAFSAVESDLSLAAACALVCFEVAAECAAKLSAGPATFKNKIVDCLFGLNKSAINRMQQVFRLF